MATISVVAAVRTHGLLRGERGDVELTAAVVALVAEGKLIPVSDLVPIDLERR